MLALKNTLAASLFAAIMKQFPDCGLMPADIGLEKPKNPQFGDIATPLAIGLGKTLKMAPPQVAGRIMQAFVWDIPAIEPDPELKRTIAGGFINFRFSSAYLQEIVRRVVRDPGHFGRDLLPAPKKILFEFVSANPTGPMVVVNARAAAIGDVLARVNQWIGNAVTREFYVNDCGNQIDLLGKSVACRYYQARGKDGVIPEGGYEGAYITDLAEEIAAEHPEIASLDEQELEAALRTYALEKNLASQRTILQNYGVTYDNWFRESELHKSAALTAAFTTLKSKGLTYEADGAVWFKATAFGDEKDRVVFRSDGSPTYFMADMAYHVHKASRGYDESVTFWGPDHHGYLPRLEASMSALALDKTVFKNFIIQQINLIKDGAPFRMSKRKGDFITITDLVEQVGVDAARYFFLIRKLSAHFDFDISLAQKKSDENPVFYVQYAHARTCNVLRHAESSGIALADIANADCTLLNEAETCALIKEIAQFPEVLMQAAAAYEPNRLTAYCESLAAAFHVFYQKHRIVTEDRPLTLARLYLTTATRNTIRLALDLLGVTAPENM